MLDCNEVCKKRCCICFQDVAARPQHRSVICRKCKELPVVFLCGVCAKNPSPRYMCRYRALFKHCDQSARLYSLKFCRGCETFRSSCDFSEHRKRCSRCQRKHVHHTRKSMRESDKQTAASACLELLQMLSHHRDRRVYLARTTVNQLVVVKFVADSSREIEMLKLVMGSTNVICYAGVIKSSAILFEYIPAIAFSV